MIEFKNFTTGYKDQTLFDKLSLKVDKNDFIGLIIPTNQGKTTLFNSMQNNPSVKISYQDQTLFVPFGVTTLFNESKIINTLLEINPDKPAMDVILHYCKIYDLKYELLNSSIKDLTALEKMKCLMLYIAVFEPKNIVFDNSLLYLKPNEKKIIWRFLINLKEKKHFLIVYITHLLNDIKYAKELIVINDGEIILQGNTKSVLKEVKTLDNMGLSLPFYVDLSHKLSLYGICHDIYYSRKGLGDNLWK